MNHRIDNNIQTSLFGEFETEDSLESISHNYLKLMLPTRIQGRVYKNFEWDKYPIEYKLLDRAFTLFALTPGMHLYHNIIYDFYVEGLTNQQLAEKYKYHKRSIQRLRKKALEEFHRFIPIEYR